MVLVASSIGMSVIVLNFNHRGPKAQRAPKWMSSFLLGRLAKILFLDGDPKYGKGAILSLCMNVGGYTHTDSSTQLRRSHYLMEYRYASHAYRKLE